MVVTAHYIDERTGVWKLKMAIIAFIQLMKSHTGERLGQAFFQIYKCVGVEKKVTSSKLCCNQAHDCH
jgi:hypothetical protein